MLRELLYTEDLFLMSETIEGLRNKSKKWMEALQCKALKVNLGKSKVMARGGTIKDGLSHGKTY